MTKLNVNQKGQILMLATPIVHDPFVFSLGPLDLTGFGIAMMAAFGIAHFVAQTVLEQRGDDAEIMNDVTFAALIGTIVGGKVYFAINEALAGRRSSALFSRAGFVYWGGFLGSVLLSWLVIRWRKQRPARWPTARPWGSRRATRSGARAAGRSATTTAACTTGRSPSHSPGHARVDGGEHERGVPHANLPATLPPESVVSVYPTQLLEVALGFVMFWILWRLRRNAHGAGWLFGMYCVLAGVERFIVEFFRAKGDVVGPLTSAQWVALAIAAVGIVLITTRRATTTLAVAR